MKKKVISLMLAACMVMGMTACGSSASTADTQPAADGTTSETQAATTDAQLQQQRVQAIRNLQFRSDLTLKQSIPL